MSEDPFPKASPSFKVTCLKMSKWKFDRLYEAGALGGSQGWRHTQLDQERLFRTTSHSSSVAIDNPEDSTHHVTFRAF